ncbi:hypothetical protein AVEN_262770-1 [Araneus ventricosus]|uniref:Uncharacterized protein n=1 Tax=Araneus ventricosus TaxID=182803 RepID=A0A4Y2CE18_ARAVE|nr:hypothetical protein AVEN_240285-1 [Araneus ventricosus]GBM02058.1 hypothetical protein AVEN_262770-1 [Araneus ventricosus]
MGSSRWQCTKRAPISDLDIGAARMSGVQEVYRTFSIFLSSYLVLKIKFTYYFVFAVSPKTDNRCSAPSPTFRYTTELGLCKEMSLPLLTSVKFQVSLKMFGSSFGVDVRHSLLRIIGNLRTQNLCSPVVLLNFN